MTATASTTAAWPLEPGTGRGRSHGTSSAEPFDRWFRYPAGFASDYVKLLVARTGLHEGTLVDCFMGSGVTGTAATSEGLRFAGIETHPLISELAALKLRADIDVTDARLTAREIVHQPAPRYCPDGETDLVRRSFSEDSLVDLVALRGAIRQLGETTTAYVLKWALLGTLRDVAQVKVGWPYQRPGVARKAQFRTVRERFLTRVAMITEDVESAGTQRPESTLVVGDSSDSRAWKPIPKSQACITSPPYLNNFDYADATRLELYFWGDVTTWREMCDSVRSGMVVATTQQSSKPGKEVALVTLRERYGETGEKIIRLTNRVADAKESRGGRAKEYDQVIPAYFVSISRVLENLLANLDAGSPAIWLVGDSAPYGTYIDTPALIAELAGTIGFEPSDDVLLRRRGERWGRDRGCELSERMIVLKKPPSQDA